MIEPQDVSDPGHASEASAPRWGVPALSRAIEGGVVLVSEEGTVDFVSPNTEELHRGLDFATWWSWLQKQIDASIDREALMRDGEAAVSISLPEALGGRSLFIQLFPVDEEDCVGYLAVLKDQSGLDALQVDLRLASQMRRLAVTLRQATHDLKAPLQAMTLNADLLRRELSTELDDDAPLERLQVIERELRRLGRMVQMLLTQSPSSKETSRRFDVRRLVRELATLMRPQTREAKVKLEVQTPRTQVPLLAVRDHLKQALLNLIVNAMEAMPDGGTLSLQLSTTDTHAVFEIHDTGCGISDEIRAKLFKLHFTTKTTGTGIGLFTAQATVQKLGGQLSLESDGRTGTTARVALPLAAFQAEEELPCSTS
ncbi:MAG: hypothetical protein DHS20C15_19940 [Planctomycetota bacterium]|nr:MAG: hypothetical protein DHS20C15_19940 [Planctomycetota bacterium]